MRPVPRAARIADPAERRRVVESDGTWMYRFDLGDGVVTRLHDEYLDHANRTIAEMIFPRLDDAFGDRWPGVRCLDMACNEGFYGMEVARRGAREVVGVEAREKSAGRAELIRAQRGIENISFYVGLVHNLTPQHFGLFDLTLCLGLLYHLEDPAGALRKLRGVTRELCVVDTEVLRAAGNATVYRGVRDGLVETGDVMALLAEQGYEDNPLASVTGLAVVPTLSALYAMLRAVGFHDIERLAPPPDAAPPYLAGDRVILFARV
jgi:hypothetical protein